MKRKNLNQIILSLIPLLTLVSFTSLYQPVKAQSQTQINRNTLKRPINAKQNQQSDSGSNRGRPTRRRGMGSRNDCPATNIPLTALIPENKVGKVAEENPKFWFYIPYKASKIPRGEFVLQDEAHNDVYRTDFLIEKGEGIVSVNLGSGKSLETNKIYQWYFKLYCDRDKSSTPIYVRGWVQKVALEPQRQKQLNVATSSLQRFSLYAENDIWYSALAELAKLKQANPENQAIIKYWLQLLNNVGLQELSNMPIVGSVD